MSIRKSARRTARELTLQGLYAWLISKEQAEIGVIEANLREQENYEQADKEWLNQLFHGVLAQADLLRAQFLPYTERDLSELSVIEHGVLLIGSYELVHSEDVPYRVVINEAVELSKEFGGTDGFKFVNGVLDKLAAKVRPYEVKAKSR